MNRALRQTPQPFDVAAHERLIVLQQILQVHVAEKLIISRREIEHAVPERLILRLIIRTLRMKAAIEPVCFDIRIAGQNGVGRWHGRALLRMEVGPGLAVLAFVLVTQGLGHFGDIPST